MKRLLIVGFLIVVSAVALSPTSRPQDIRRGPAAAAAGGSNPTFVQGTGNLGGSVNSISKAYTSNVTSGNLSVVGCTAYDQDLGTGSVTSGCVTTYTRQVVDNTGNGRMAWYTGTINATGACTVTCTPAAGTFIDMGIAEVSGATAVDTTAAGKTGTSTGPNTNNLVTSTGTIMFASVANWTSTTAITPGYTEIYENEDANTQLAASFEYRTNASSGTYTLTWTFGGSLAWRTLAIAIK